MQHQLHKNNIPCHLDQSEGSPFQIFKSLNLQTLLFSIIYSLFSVPATAQNYQWQWAINGGGSIGSNGWDFQAEQIFDVVIDKNNNYYFVAKIENGTPKLAGQPVTVYGNQAGGNDIFLFSTTCSGQVRWSQAIGGGGLFDAAYKIALDSNNNVFVGANVSLGNTTKPVYFSPTDALPPRPAYNPNDPNGLIPSDGYKTTFLVKYNSNGQFVWKCALQGDVGFPNNHSSVLSIVIDSKDNLHFIIGFLHGTHLNNTITVPTQYKYDSTTAWGYVMKYYLVRYNSAGQLLNSMPLPIADGSMIAEPSFTFKYDEPNNRYYIAGFRSYVNVNENVPLTYGGSAIINNAYILAVNATNGSELWRREMEADSDDCRIYDLDVDTNGDIFIAGKFSRIPNTGVKIIDPKKPTTNPYNFSFGKHYGNMPFIAKLTKNGEVKWARTPNNDTSNMYYSHSLVIRGNEVALATEGTYMIWDSFSMNQQFINGLQPNPVLVRFNKQTGTVIGLHDIEGSMNYHKLTSVAVDNDGNYVVGGTFNGNLFATHKSINMLVTNGHYDFFVAKLAATPCGTSVSTTDFNNIKVNVYPNPTTDIVNIETEETLQSYEVYNVLGQQVQKDNFNGNNQVNLHGVTAGTYFIKVTTQQGSAATVKVVKK
ncbi:T9SS type A sorting domain-containing protein [Flavobacterium sp. xlx-214]|uniref:T9SS type A sorting domain-containing protein n=1 Tax=unclassified Flavobacterium TaxID=196869 RepID=UPI0013D8CE9F|nr:MULTISPECIES: T9SS type A sorting domain-containing protein [unclassified Flavobacterium]MBA5792683.1 T9SS type A sorting domain-containing protein [Flavobacterium sp. xlx-221]QMI83828.1 T9SS type A sorting domain-containing protein [Flavobacterium sp. xlx-214]